MCVAEKGVSVIVCCYNSAWVIERTLKALCNQRNIGLINYEIILVDNNCQDNTVQIAQLLFGNYPNIRTSIVHELRPGLMYARETGIKNSIYSYLLYCDDDNLLCENYVSEIYSAMSSDSNIGACGGFGVPEFYNSVKPDWFDGVESAYAIGKQKTSSSVLYGAGCCFRKEVLELLYERGFKPLLTGRKGNQLLAGDDSELVKAVIIVGFRIRALNSIFFIHVLSSQRLEKEYLYKMAMGFGLSYFPLNVYNCVIKGHCFNIFSIGFYYMYFLGKYIYLFVRLLFKPSSVRLKFEMFFIKGELNSYNFFDFKCLEKQFDFMNSLNAMAR